MPQAVAKNGHQLAIRLDRADHTYAPGETLTGHVCRKSDIVTPKATICISLHARSKSRMVSRRGHLTSTHRGRFDLVKSTDYSQTIFDGPLHITINDNEQIWAFSITLPTHVDLSTLRSMTDQNQSYVSTNARDASDYRLPPTFLIERYEYMSGMSAFVEYYLQAELKVSSRGSTNTTDAILPFKMLHLNPEPSRNRPSLHLLQHHISTQSDPNLEFDIQIQIPTVLQIDNPDPLHLTVLAIPSATNYLQYLSRKICITRIFLNVIARTEIKCPTRKAVRQADNETRINLHAEDAHRKYGEELYVPWKRLTTEEQASQNSFRTSDMESQVPLDIGKKIGILVERRQDLYATFTTFNIQHTHHLKWEMTVQIEGNSFELSGEDPIKILSRPELERNTEWIQPPPEDQLPDFADYQEELVELDTRRGSHRSEDMTGGVGGLSRLWVL
ncbi:hypothetical protein FSARC_7807 [Fusarium sarcochroum]|uniref:Arrestin-like N-terminal domain-containing protein n=1 Tax=Fusarium sarcochroum TaxID=1208366 RepID=A0A8H4TUK9_9HYPO|nr:hypothetical protein FSARC_7807 [Fusarium sarcochroum]